jgi:hypothetical protein
MPDSDDFYDMARIIYGINHSVVTNTNAPAILCTDEFAATGRARLYGQGAKRLNNSNLDNLL